MPDGEVAAPAPAGPAEGAAPRAGGSFLSGILRMIFMWGLMSYMKSGGNGGVNKQAVSKDPAAFSTPLFTKVRPWTPQIISQCTVPSHAGPVNSELVKVRVCSMCYACTGSGCGLLRLHHGRV